MKGILGRGISLLILVSVIAARPRPPLAHFQLTLERSAKGWLAQCDSGCAWTELSVVCGEDRLDSLDRYLKTLNANSNRSK